MKIGIYTADEILEFMTEGEGRGFLGRSMFDAMYFEIERLNNIINEIEKYLIEEIEDYDKHINSQYITDITREQYEGEKVCFEDMLGRLQELKGVDKE